MSVLMTIIGFAALVILWAIAWHKQAKLALGILIGVGVGWLFAAVSGPFSIEEIPIWLPPLPFALVALALLVFGILAWLWDEKPQGTEGDGRPASRG